MQKTIYTSRTRAQAHTTCPDSWREGGRREREGGQERVFPDPFFLKPGGDRIGARRILPY